MASKAAPDETLVDEQTYVTDRPYRGLEGMAEGVRGSSTVAFHEPRNEGKPHACEAKELTFHECVDGVTPKSTSPTDRKHECMKMFGGDYVVALEPVVIVRFCIPARGLRRRDNHLRAPNFGTGWIVETDSDRLRPHNQPLSDGCSGPVHGGHHSGEEVLIADESPGGDDLNQPGYGNLE